MFKKNNILFLILFCFFIQQKAHAYIDPGVGSMLFSIVIGIVGSVCFLLNVLFIKIKHLFCFDKKLAKNNIPFVIYCEGKQYYNIFKPILDEFEKRKIPLVCYTSSKDDKILEDKYEYVETSYIGESFEAFLKLAFLKADICLMTTPGLDVLQLKRSKYTKYYCHIFHAISSSMGYRLFGLDYYDGVLCDAKFQINLIEELENKRKIKCKDKIVVGSSYMDYLSQKIDNLPKKDGELVVLLAPSWGENSILNKYGQKIIDNLSKGDFKTIIRPHPQTLKNDKNLIEDLKIKNDNNPKILWDFGNNALETMSRADIMLGDFSAIIFEWAFFFEKTFLFLNQDFNAEIYDYADLDEIPYRFQAVKKMGYEIKEEDIENIAELVVQLNKDNKKNEEIKRIKDYFWEKRGESAKNIVDFLIKKQEELS